MNIKFDDSEFKKKVSELEKRVKTASSRALVAIGNEVMRLSTFEVPHDKGILQNSANIEPSGNEILIGYNTVYAARLHEHPEYNFQKGRKGKYLEDPIKNNLDVLRGFYGREIQLRVSV